MAKRQTFIAPKFKDSWSFRGMGRRQYKGTVLNRAYGLDILEGDRDKPTFEAPRGPGEPEG